MDSPSSGANAGSGASEAEAIVRRAVSEIMNGAEYALVRDLYAPGFVLHMLGAGSEIRGHEGYVEYLRTFREAFPDFEVSVDDAFALSDRVCLRTTIRGTHLGEYVGFAATGETFETASMHVFRVEDGRIHEQWQLADALGMLQQLDLLSDSPGKVARLVLGRVKSRLVGSR